MEDPMRNPGEAETYSGSPNSLRPKGATMRTATPSGAIAVSSNLKRRCFAATS